VAGLLPPKYQQPKSLVSFGASIFGMISIFLLWLLGFRTLTAVSVIISIFLALGALYGLLLSVSARFLARQFPSKEL
jgi:hypothetical protein